MERKCRICGVTKDISEFHVSSKGVGGRDTRCRECKNRIKRETDKSPEGRKKNKEYISTDDYKQRRKERKWSGACGVSKVQKEIERRNNKYIASFRYVSRDEALEFGLPRYFDGSECKNGHISERQTASRCCVECARERGRTKEGKAAKKEYYLKNKERLMSRNIERQRERYAESSECRAGIAARNMLKRVLYLGGQKEDRGNI